MFLIESHVLSQLIFITTAHSLSTVLLPSSRPLHQQRVLGHVPIAPQKFGDTGQNFRYYNVDHILNSFHSNLILELIENITSLV